MANPGAVVKVPEKTVRPTIHSPSIHPRSGKPGEGGRVTRGPKKEVIKEKKVRINALFENVRLRQEV